MELEVNVLSRDGIKKKIFLKSYEQTNQAINVPTESIIVEFLARIVLTCALVIVILHTYVMQKFLRLENSSLLSRHEMN